MPAVAKEAPTPASSNGGAKPATASHEPIGARSDSTPAIAAASTAATGSSAYALAAPEKPDGRATNSIDSGRLGVSTSGNGSNGHKRVDYASIDYSRFTRKQTLLRAVTTAGLSVLARIEAEGLENIPTSGPCIIAVNHLSKVDTPLLMSRLTRRTVMLANEKYRSSPIINFVISEVGQAIYVTPNELDERALQDALSVLHSGGVIGLAPEGARSKTGGLMRARSGAAYLAVAANVPVVPVAAWGQENWRSRMRSLRRIPIFVRAGKPLVFPPGPATPQQLLQYTDAIMHALAAMLPESYRGVYGNGQAGATPAAESRRARSASSSS
jgi:1-acyl-sn-glycerol-3-phosphate acyltransferase